MNAVAEEVYAAMKCSTHFQVLFQRIFPDCVRTINRARHAFSSAFCIKMSMVPAVLLAREWRPFAPSVLVRLQK